MLVAKVLVFRAFDGTTDLQAPEDESTLLFHDKSAEASGIRAGAANCKGVREKDRRKDLLIGRTVAEQGVCGREERLSGQIAE